MLHDEVRPDPAIGAARKSKAKPAGLRGLSCLILLLVCAQADGQRVLSIDLAGAQVRYADTLSTAAFAISPLLKITTTQAELTGSATVSQLRVGGWSLQSALSGGWYTRPIGPLTGELNAAAGASAHRDGTRTGQGIALARAHLMGRRVGAWIGAGLGSYWDGVDWRGVHQGEVAVWAQSSGQSALLTLSPTSVDDSIQFADAVLALEWKHKTVELSALAGYRAGDRSALLGGTASTWGSVSANLWLTPRVALVAGGGTYPVDLTQGFPGGRFFSAGLRLRAQPRTEPQTILAPAVASAANSIAAFEIAAAAGSQMYTLRARVRQAHSVEVNGDFTNWKPVSLIPAATGWWTALLRITPGTHQLNVRIDGGPWLVPPGLSSVADEFGGAVGILNVSR